MEHGAVAVVHRLLRILLRTLWEDRNDRNDGELTVSPISTSGLSALLTARGALWLRGGSDSRFDPWLSMVLLGKSLPPIAPKFQRVVPGKSRGTDMLLVWQSSWAKAGACKEQLHDGTPHLQRLSRQVRSAPSFLKSDLVRLRDGCRRLGDVFGTSRRERLELKLVMFSAKMMGPGWFFAFSFRDVPCLASSVDPSVDRMAGFHGSTFSSLGL